MMDHQDKYFKLHPPEPTPADEICDCPGAPPIKLMCALGYNPIQCLNCNGEIPPEMLDLNWGLIESVAYWRNVYDALDRLWLDSADYEEWAKAQLTDIAGRVN